MDNNPSIDIAKKEIQKVIINELYKKGVIDFCESNNIIKKLDENINKLKELQDKDVKNIIVKIQV